MSEIKLGSKSYPYLAVAKHYNVPYRDVLAFFGDWLSVCAYALASRCIKS